MVATTDEHVDPACGLDDYVERNELATELEESEAEDSSDEESKPLSRATRDEIEKFEDSFKGITQQYRVVDRIGEGSVLVT